MHVIRHEYDLPDGRGLCVLVHHDLTDVFERLRELGEQLMKRRHELDINYHTISMIMHDMKSAAEEQLVDWKD